MGGLNQPSSAPARSPREAPRDAAHQKQRDLLAEVEKEQQIDHKEYADGGMGTSSDERKKRTPEEIAKFPLLEKGKTYLAKGTVNRVPFKQTIRDKHWYYEMAVAGKKLIENFDSVAFDFPALKNKQYKERMKAAISNITVSSVDLIADKLTPEQFKTKIEEGFSKEEIYGSQGIFNIILAFGRAYDLVNNVQEGASIDYRLSLGNKRYSQLLTRKKEVERKAAVSKPVAKVAAKPAADKITPPAAAEVKNSPEWNEYNEKMKVFSTRTDYLTSEVNAVEKDGGISKEEAGALRLRIKAIESKIAPLASGEKVPADAQTMYENTTKAIQTLRADFEAAKMKNKPVKREEEPRGLPVAPTEVQAQAERALSRNSFKASYELAEGQTLEKLADIIARDAMKVVAPAVGSKLYDSLVDRIRGIVFAHLNTIDRENRAKNISTRIFVLEPQVQNAIISALLLELKLNNIKSDIVMDFNNR